MVEVGQKFGRLTVLEIVRRNGRKLARCQCECGTETLPHTFNLPTGRVVSCGCHSAERTTVHGVSRTPEYKAWQTARRRCTNPADPNFHRYGGRGITMCAEWLNDPVAFIDYIGTRPTPKHTLDRIDVNGGYTPGNVRWATWEEQACNKRNNPVVTVAGESMTLPEASRRWGVPLYSIRNRLKRGWPSDQAVGAAARAA